MAGPDPPEHLYPARLIGEHLPQDRQPALGGDVEIDPLPGFLMDQMRMRLGVGVEARLAGRARQAGGAACRPARRRVQPCTSKRSSIITLFQAATKSATNFPALSDWP